MPELYSKVEIVRPRWNTEEWAQKIFSALFMLALLTLVVWWFFAAWFPELGFTYWQLVLPVFVFRQLIGRGPIGRQLDK